MSYLRLLFLATFVASCCASKPVAAKTQVENTKEKFVTAEVVNSNSTQVPIPEPPKAPKLEEVAVINQYQSEIFNHNRWNKLLKKNVSDSGNVNYLAFKNDKTELHLYIDSLSENLPTAQWTKPEKLAYWINAYNAMTVDLIIKNYPIKSIKDIKNPWDQRLWKLGEEWYSLNQIEHEILRKMDEPRIHFAIVCASVSCPKLQNQAFTASKLEDQLTKATKAFLADQSKNEITPESIKISKIFQWFAKDFKQNSSLIDFLNLYSEIKIYANAKKSFKAYNWDLNE